MKKKVKLTKSEVLKIKKHWPELIKRMEELTAMAFSLGLGKDLLEELKRRGGKINEEKIH